MRYHLDVNGTLRTVDVRREEGVFVVAIDDWHWTVDARPTGPQALSLLLTPGALPPETPRDDSAQSPSRVVSREVSIAAVPGEAGRFTVLVGAIAVPVAIDGRRRWSGGRSAAAEATGPQRLTAPMPGRIVRVLAPAGSQVAPRQSVVVIEAMKMENELRSPVEGIVSDVLVTEGQSVEAGAVLAVVTPR